MEINLERPFRHHGGFSYQKDLFDFVSVADIPGEDRSTLQLFEDDLLLGPAHIQHSEVAAKGNGRYSHWVQGIWFSASDNSDPNENGRSYRIIIDDTKVEMAKSSNNVDFEIYQTFSCMNSYCREPFPVFRSENKINILEIGARYLGVAALFAARGAYVTVIEPEGIQWDDERSPLFYKSLAERAESQGISIVDQSVFDVIIESKGKVTPRIEVLETTVEEMNSREYSNRFDLVLSNSVLEHIFDPERTMENLAKCSKPWSLARHGVDYRDHSNFSDPLNFLFIDDAEFRQKIVAHDTARGNRLRPSELEYWFTRMNFSIKERIVRSYNTDDYVNKFLQESKEKSQSRLYRNCIHQDLYENSIAYSLVLMP